MKYQTFYYRINFYNKMAENGLKETKGYLYRGSTTKIKTYLNI